MRCRKTTLEIQWQSLASILLSEISSANSVGVMNTMIDYYLMSYSNAIISLSTYGHVSGFSKYCAILNNIPFTFKQIIDPNQ
jgi:hypothetical protein